MSREASLAERGGPHRLRRRPGPDDLLGWLVFLSVILLLTGSMHGYLYTRLSEAPILKAHGPMPVAAVLILLWATTLSGFLLERVLPAGLARVLAWVGHVWQGTSFLLLCTMLATEPLRHLPDLLARFPGIIRLELPLSADLDGLLTLSALGLGLLLAASAIASATNGPRLVRVRVAHPAIPPEWNGLRILQVSDLHVGNTIRQGYVERLARRIRDLDPDMLALTGDLVDGSVSRLAPELAPLLAWKPRHGIHFVPGNHEYYAGVEPWLDHLRQAGVTVLRNAHVVLEQGGAPFVVAGVDDFAARRFGGPGPDLDAALSGSPARTPILLLAHQPPAIEAARKAGVSLQLSGHTHGGQIVPFNFLVRLDQPHVAGLFRKDDTWLYVSRGTGWWGPPMRLGAPSEITLLELVSG